MKKNTFILLILVSSLLVLPLFGTACASETYVDEKVGVVVSILPLADFVENVGGEKINVGVMVPPGASPHTYEPSPKQVVALAEAEMYAKVGSGIEFELAWMDKLEAANSEMLVVDCSSGTSMAETDEETGQNEESHHGAMDPHIWMSPLNACVMVRNICDGLVRVDPPNSEYYEKNSTAYQQELAALDRDIRESLSVVSGGVFMVYHPAFGYFARDYNLVMVPVEEDGKEPTAASLTRIIGEAKERGIKVIFTSPQVNPQSVEVIARAIDGRVVFIDVLAKDYIANMRLLLDEIVTATEL